MGKKILISHAEENKEYAEALLSFLEKAKDGGSDIACSSVAGYDLRPGFENQAEIKNWLRSIKSVWVIISHESLSSDWVWFELGAAWLNEAYIVPIVLPGLTYQDLPKPINGINAILVEKNFYGGGCDVSIRVCKLPAGVQICTGHFPDGRERHRTFSIKHIQPDAEDAALITVVRAVGALLAYPVTRARFIVKKGECCSTLKLVCTRKRVPRRKRAAMRLSAERSLAPR